jgi:mitochondrial fission protein ELM1
MGETTHHAGPTTWVVTDGAAGIVNQCVGLASRLDLTPTVKTIAIRQPWRLLPPGLWWSPLRALDPREGDRLEPPWPDLLIASGRKSVAPCAAIRRASGGHTLAVQIQNPGIASRHFDLVVAPRHDNLSGANVIATKGSLHGLSRDLLDVEAAAWAESVAHLPRPLVFAAIGGPNRVFRFGEEDARRLGRQLASLPGGLMLTVSRRTTPEAANILLGELDGERTVIWNGEGANPYRGWLGLAETVVVTSDSVNMTSEACITGKPVLVAHLQGGSKKFSAFHDLMETDGHTRRFGGSLVTDWKPVVLDDTTMVAGRVRALLDAQK